MRLSGQFKPAYFEHTKTQIKPILKQCKNKQTKNNKGNKFSHPKTSSKLLYY